MSSAFPMPSPHQRRAEDPHNNVVCESEASTHPHSLCQVPVALIGGSDWLILEPGADSGIVDKRKALYVKILNCRLCSDCIKCAPTWDSKERERRKHPRHFRAKPCLESDEKCGIRGIFLSIAYSIWNAAVAGVSGLEVIRSGFHQSTTVFKVCLT